MIIPTARLDPTSLAYLQQVQKTRGASENGAFFRMWAWSTSAAVTFWLIVLGLAALGFLVYLGWPQPDMQADLTRFLWQTASAAVGALCLTTAVIRIARRRSKDALGSFRYFDALHMWVVRPRRVEAVPLESLQDINGTLYRGKQNYALIVLSLPEGRRSFTIPNPDRSQVEYLVRFVHTMIRLRNSDDAGMRALAQGSPALAAAIATRVARGQSLDNLSNMQAGGDPPRPTEVEPATAPSAAGRLAPFLPWAAAAAAGAAAFLVAPIVDRMVLDEYLYARADREAKGQHSPSSLRAYLADPYNVRHRAEAQASINVFYDEAIAKLKKQAEGKAMDDSVFQSVLALLEALKKTDRPVVTVGFRGTQDVTPSTDELKTKEEVNYDALLDEKPELKTVADQSSGKTAILPPGDTFTAENTRTRESVILGRLRDSVQKMLGADVITLAPVTAGEAPVMEVTYHAYADGSLYLYTTTSENQFGLQPMEEVKGLLRKYEVSWVITIRPPGTDQTYESKLGSVAGSQIHYDSRPEDPSWAPYAIILYSAFNDMSKRLAGDFAAGPETLAGAKTEEETYSFADVITAKTKP